MLAWDELAWDKLGAMALLVVVLIAAALLLVGFAVLVRKGAASARARIDERLAELRPERTTKVNFYGTESRGASQVRGLGTLALTADELVFLQLVPAYELVVPRAAISELAVAQRFLGKTQGRDLLVVAWQEGDGSTDRAAFDIPELDAWRSALEVGD